MIENKVSLAGGGSDGDATFICFIRHFHVFEVMFITVFTYYRYAAKDIFTSMHSKVPVFMVKQTKHYFTV